MSPRLTELLDAAADSFSAMVDPFSTPWLVEHDVTADECHEMSAAIAAAIVTFLVVMT